MLNEGERAIKLLGIKSKNLFLPRIEANNVYLNIT